MTSRSQFVFATKLKEGYPVAVLDASTGAVLLVGLIAALGTRYVYVQCGGAGPVIRPARRNVRIATKREWYDAGFWGVGVVEPPSWLREPEPRPRHGRPRKRRDV